MKEPERPSNDPFPLTNNTHRTNSSMKVTYVPRNSKPPRTGWTYTKWALKGAFCLASALAGTFVGNLYWKSPITAQIMRNFIMHPTDPLASYKPDLQFPIEKQHEITLMLLGTDHDYDERRPGVYLKGTRGRSDAILLAKVNFDTGSIKAMSVPRDCYVHIPDHGFSRVNAAYALGGADLTKETIKSVFGINVDYYAAFDFEGFKKIVDALGGIELDVQRDMKYDDTWGNLHINLKKGFQHLTGNQAMGYVRYRHGDNDIMRASRQQQFVEAMREKIKSPKTLMNLSNVLNALMDNLSTDMTTDQMLTLGNYAKGLKRENIEVGTVPVTESPSYVYIKQGETEELIRRLFYPDGLTPVSVNIPSKRAILASNDRPERKHGKRGRAGRRTDEASLQNPDDSTQDSLTPDAGNDATPVDHTDTPPTETPDTNTPRPEPPAKPAEGGTNSGAGKQPSGGTTPSGGGEPSPSGNNAL